MPPQIRTAARGSHFVAWAEGETPDRPLDAVLLVGQTEEEAREAAQRWLESRSAPDA